MKMKFCMKTFLFYVMGMLFWMPLSYAQTRTVQGHVTDDGAGTGLSGVTVTVKGTTVSTQTDSEGRYTIQVSGQQAVLVFTSVGATAQEETVGDRSVIDVSLVAGSELLDELVVVGY